MNHKAELTALSAAALRGADPGRAVRRFLAPEPGCLRVGDARLALEPSTRIGIIALGKAALGMARAALEALAGLGAVDPDRVPLVIAHPAGVERGDGWPAGARFFAAGHPLPDAASLAAAGAAAEICVERRPADILLVLVSGGGSALFERPRVGIDLEDLRGLTRALQAGGADIHELNSVRRALSAVKGGGLAAQAFPARVVTLIVSDVPGDEPAEVASGPTLPSPTSAVDALAVLERYQAAATFPRIAAALRGCAPGPLPAGTRNLVFVVASGRTALESAGAEARGRGFEVVVDPAPLVGDAREAGRKVARTLLRLRATLHAPQLPVCALWAGETTVTVRGRGRGGRNQELALAAAIALENCSRIAVLACATDGIDGPTDAAGAMVNGATVTRARALGISAVAALDDNDSHGFFHALGELVRTGPTGTNVSDLTFALVYP